MIGCYLQDFKEHKVSAEDRKPSEREREKEENQVFGFKSEIKDVGILPNGIGPCLVSKRSWVQNLWWVKACPPSKIHHGTSRDEQSRVQISVGLF